MIFVGIDQSYTSTGYCVIEDDIILDFGIFTSSPNDTIYYRAGQIAHQLTELIIKYPDCLVSIEGLAFGISGKSTRDLAGLQYVIIDRITEKTHIKEISIISPKSIKKYATGTGGSIKKKVTKQDMVQSLDPKIQELFKSRFKISKGLYDITDAYYLARYYRDELYKDK